MNNSWNKFGRGKKYFTSWMLNQLSQYSPIVFLAYGKVDDINRDSSKTRIDYEYYVTLLKYAILLVYL